jgi:hypothetical protein
MKSTLPYNLAVLVGFMAVVVIYVFPASTDSLVRLIAIYVVYLIFREIFAPGIERGRQADERYQAVWGRIPKQEEKK